MAIFWIKQLIETIKNGFCARASDFLKADNKHMISYAKYV